MNEEQLNIFVDCVRNYFLQVEKNEAVEFGTPFINDPEHIKDLIMNYTGTIAISGDFQGALYITTGREFLVSLAKKILEIQTVEDGDIIDIAGEFANTIAGNARKTFGKGFEISVPLIISGKFFSMNLPRLKSPTYILPFIWRGEKSYLCIGLDRIAE